jgi:hypothetical protein
MRHNRVVSIVIVIIIAISISKIIQSEKTTNTKKEVSTTVDTSEPP